MKKKISFLSSHGEANELDAKLAAKLTPAQHLANAHELITTLYAEELLKPMNKKLNFRDGKIP